MSEATTAVKEITLKPEVEEFSQKFRDASKIEHKKGDAQAFVVTDATFYTSTLDQALNPKLVEKFPGIIEALPEIINDVQTHNTRVVAGVARGVSQLGEAYLVKHKDVTRVSADVTTIKKDGIEVTYDRERTVPSRNEDGSMGTATQHGSLRVAVRSYAAEAVGELKKVKQLSVQSAARAYGG
jgi:hypothetical protein